MRVVNAVLTSRALLVVLATSFAVSASFAQDHGHDEHGHKDKDESHGHDSPHGGTVRSIGDYHVELVFHKGNGKLTLYVLGGDEKTGHRIAAKSLTAQCKASDRDGYVAVTLAAAPQKGESKGACSRFEGDVGDLATARSFQVVVHVPVGSRRYRATFTVRGGRSDADHEHGDGPLHSADYRMDLVARPESFKAGDSVTLVFTPRRSKDGSVVNRLDIVHERPMHLIMVSKDLGWYAHEHPVLQENGSLSLPFAFPFGGDYILFAELTPAGGKQQVFRLPLHAEGTPKPGPDLRQDTGDTRRIGEYEITVKLEPSPVAGKRVTLAYQVRRAGKDVTDLEHYLGAAGHCVFISRDGSRYLHSHPVGAEGGHHHGHHESDIRAGPTVRFQIQFPVPGLYKGWAQFKHKGKILTAPFVVRVPEKARHHR